MESGKSIKKIRGHAANWLMRPRLIRMGISKFCNFRCLMCWSYSPLLKKQKEDSWKKIKIDRDLAICTIREAGKIGFKKILFSGSGEPFTHPHMMNFVKEAAANKLGVIIQTNLSLVDPAELVKVLKGVRNNSIICAHISASSPQTYKKVHPGVSKKDFYDVLNKIKFLLKNNVKVRMVYVVINQNYQEIENAIKLNNKIGSFLHLKLADFVPGEGVGNISVNEEERMALVENLAHLQGKDKETNSNISDFLAQAKYGGIGKEKIKRCLIGYNFCVVDERGDVRYCFNGKSNNFFMGNLRQRSLKNIWFSREYNTLRERLKNGKFLKECANYCIKNNSLNVRGANFKIRFYIDPEINPPLL